MNERRIQRIQELIKERVAEVVDQDLADPRRGLITITRVKVDKENQHCIVYWSVLGDDKVRRKNEGMLRDATGYVQREVAAVLHTRTVPKVKFVFDEAIEGSMRIESLLHEIRQEREERGGSDETGTVEMGTVETGADETGTAQPGTGEPATGESGTGEPSDDQKQGD